MGVFVGQQSATRDSCCPVRKVVGTQAVLTRLVVLQALATNRVADRKEKIIVIIMMRIEKLLRLDDKVLMVLQLFRSDLEICRLVGEDIEVHQVVRPCGQI
jgi:hypothetical protein